MKEPFGENRCDVFSRPFSEHIPEWCPENLVPQKLDSSFATPLELQGIFPLTFSGKMPGSRHFFPRPSVVVFFPTSTNFSYLGSLVGCSLATMPLKGPKKDP